MTEAEREADNAWNMALHYMRVLGLSDEAHRAITAAVRAYGVAMKEQGKAEA